MNKKRFLVFSPHPDDVDFGCSGTVAKITKQGNEVIYCVVTNGEKGLGKDKDSLRKKINLRQIAKIREKEQKTAAGIVGVKKVIFLREKDGEVENAKELRKKLVRVVRQVRPEIVIGFDPANLAFDNFYRSHRDHRKVAEAVFDSLYPSSGSAAFFPELKEKPHQIKEAWFFGGNSPNFFIDISQTIDKKLSALKSHQSQIKNEKALEKRVLGWARETGKKKKMKYAEAFRRLELLSL